MFRFAPTAWLTTLGLVAFQVLGLLAFAFPIDWRLLPLAVAMYLWMCLSTTLYLHRAQTHRALDLAWPMRLFFALGTAVGQQGSPITWVGHHRWHHAKSDVPGEDIHSPNEGFWYSHMGWLTKFAPQEEAKLARFAKDVADRDPYLKALESPLVFLLPHLAVAAALGASLGLGGLLFCLYLPMTVLYHVTWCVNSVCHLPAFGYRRYETTDGSRNVWWVGLLAMGEGWHNNHHAAPGRAPQGQAWWELDGTTAAIWLLERLGLAWNVKWQAAETGLARPSAPAPVPAGPSLPATVAAQGEGR